MLSLKSRIVAILEGRPDAHSTDTEADQILLHAFKQENFKFISLNQMKLTAPQPTPEVELEAVRIAEARAHGFPLQHLLGYQYFFEHEYYVNDSTLIPRPETEVLVDAALEWIDNNFPQENFSFAELGLGTGVISGEVLARFTNAQGMASEVNHLAIALARQNLEKILGPAFDERFQIIEPENETKGFEVFLKKGPFDLILSNPPYVSRQDEIQEEVLKHEPHLALFPKTGGAAEEPNYFYENFLKHAKKLLKPKGTVFFEVPHERADCILKLFQNAGFSSTLLRPDLTGRYRVLQATY